MSAEQTIGIQQRGFITYKLKFYLDQKAGVHILADVSQSFSTRSELYHTTNTGI